MKYIQHKMKYAEYKIKLACRFFQKKILENFFLAMFNRKLIRITIIIQIHIQIFKTLLILQSISSTNNNHIRPGSDDPETVEWLSSSHCTLNPLLF